MLTVIMLVTGAFRISGGHWRQSKIFTPSQPLLFSDWDCAVFDDGINLMVHCGNNTYVMEGTNCQFCSSEDTLYISNQTSLIALDKRTGVTHTLQMSCLHKMACSGDSVYYIDDDNQLRELIGGTDQSLTIIHSPSPPSLKVKSLACGSGFVICLTLDGQLFSKGLGSRGQLGLGDLDDRDKLCMIEALAPLTVISISAGCWHSACITDSGDLYTWGWNEHGQLGHPSFSIAKKNAKAKFTTQDDLVNVAYLPRPVDIPEEEDITSVSCGARHTVCLTASRKVIVFGWNGFGQLGLDDSVDAIDVPRVTSLPDDATVESVSCGHWCTSVTLNKDN